MDIYLHKKFKKQLSVDHHHHNHHRQREKENRGDPPETAAAAAAPPPDDRNPAAAADNNSPSVVVVVPNQSTNAEAPPPPVIPPKSSISVTHQSLITNPSISSYVVDDSFDNSFKTAAADDRCSPPTNEDICAKTTAAASASGGGGGKYVCTYCNLVCSKPSVLQKHIRAHTNERPYPCTSCGFSFKTRSNLYKHCRSRTHANRVLGNNKSHESAAESDHGAAAAAAGCEPGSQDAKNKPYKPRFHTTATTTVDEDKTTDLSHHINEIISKNNSIVNSADNSALMLKKRTSDGVVVVAAESVNNNNNNGDYHQRAYRSESKEDEPLNLSNKNRKRSLSEATEPGAQRSLIKELLLKNLYSDMQCPFCKMIFQTVTELELHKLRSCKGKPCEAKYTRSSSVNVASILTKNKNAFDNMPQFQHTVFPLQSPGPFLGRTRLVESDKSKSFSFDGGHAFSLFEKEKKAPVKLFGGEVKVQGETKSFRVDNNECESSYEFKVSESRVVKSSLQAGGTVLTNKYGKEESRTPQDVIRVYEGTALSPKIDIVNNYHHQEARNIMDFSQNAVKLLTPNIKQPLAFSFTVPEPIVKTTSVVSKKATEGNFYAPMNLLVDGKVVRYVPGMPGPVAAEPPVAVPKRSPKEPPIQNCPKTTAAAAAPPVVDAKKFTRPNSLALKPTTASLKQHHGLTPTIFNQILISPDTPRVQKKYAQHFLHGNYFSYLGLKSSTRPVYCTLNKTQPFYVPHFKKLSMYSEWRQQDNKTDKLYVSAYDSRQRNQRYSTAGRAVADLIIHSSYKFIVSELPSNKSAKDGEDGQRANPTLGFECNDDYPYIRGRGRGKYVCEQCGIRCKKPSMLKKHIRTHSNDRPYTCSQCNFSFKTKGNLTKHMKSKSHTKNTGGGGGGSSSSTQLSGTQSSESDTDDSGMDSSEESTRQQEHEAAYGLLSLSQKSSSGSPPSLVPNDVFMTAEEIVHVQKTNYAKNKFLDDEDYNNPPTHFNPPTASNAPPDRPPEDENVSTFLGKTGGGTRPLTYPYASIRSVPADEPPVPDTGGGSGVADKNIRQFYVVQKYLRTEPDAKINDVVVVQQDNPVDRKRKIQPAEADYNRKQQKSDEVMDLSVTTYQNGEKFVPEHRPVLLLKPIQPDETVYAGPDRETHNNNYREYDNSAMETLADVATKQVKLEKNTMAKSVASEYLKLATKNEHADPTRDSAAAAALFVAKDVNELIVKPEGNKTCPICSKSFNRPSQLRLHMNIHYLERPFRCDSCSVSFRTKGHLQKHERSASHYSKLSSSPAQSSSEPRPFKCNDCNIAFRIHGHLAKHLRSKMHIMKLECLAKIPFGLYAELERSNSLLTEINTSDGDQCLESLKILAKKVFVNDPSKLQSLVGRADADTDS